MKTREQQWTERYLQQMVGGIIVSVGTTPDDMPCFTVNNAVKKLHFCVTVQRDSEGNGPGFLGGLPLVPPVK